MITLCMYLIWMSRELSYNIGYSSFSTTNWYLTFANLGLCIGKCANFLTSSRNSTNGCRLVLATLETLKRCVAGEKGEQGPPGEQGEQGAKGEKGQPGEDGVNGKDGIDVSKKVFSIFDRFF